MNRAPTDDIGKLILRLVLGLLLLAHGIHKIGAGIGGIQDMLTSHGIPPVVAYGVYAGEVVAPLLLLAGVVSRVAGALVVINMLFALFLVHLQQVFTLTPQGGWGLELQGFFLFTGLALVFLGSGRYALRPD